MLWRGCRKSHHRHLGRLLEYIKELGSQIPRWIPVEERLPKEWVEVIVYNKDVGVLCGVCIKAGKWFDEADEWTDITHWMPIPKGPEEK